MKRKESVFILMVAVLLVAVVAGMAVSAKNDVLAAPNGITIPEGYKNWQLIGLSQRTDNNTLRVILGNTTAIQAARSGRINPWPDGTILAKLVYKEAKHDAWAAAIVPGDFVQAEFMVKDSKQYAATGGWGFARWLGMDQRPYGKDAGFVQECFNCHTPVQKNDYVFTKPVQLP